MCQAIFSPASDKGFVYLFSANPDEMFQECFVITGLKCVCVFVFVFVCVVCVSANRKREECVDQ